jgi:hypothetical protein
MEDTKEQIPLFRLLQKVDKVLHNFSGDDEFLETSTDRRVNLV